MNPKWQNVVQLLVVVYLVTNVGSSDNTNSTSALSKREREKKILSIFSVVRFANTPCQSSMTLTGALGTSRRNGTCMTSAECATNGGSSSGTCAASFGVCCVFMFSTCGSTIRRNCSYIKNPGFPTAYTDSAACSFTIAKCDNSVCDFRLDFDQFTINGPVDTSETNDGACETDSLTTTVTSGQVIPVICGGNAGQHVYLDAGDSVSGTAMLNFAFTGTGSRIWDIKVSQIPCSANYRRPDGCLQYLTGIDGRLTTFNFNGVTPQHLDGQDYNICIRQEEGYCCIRYTPCADPVPSFALDLGMGGAPTMAKVDTLCTSDYIRIEGAQCPGSLSFRNLFCGGILSDTVDALANCGVEDCSQPFQVGVFTSTANPMNVNNDLNGNRGVCLEYQQVPC